METATNPSHQAYGAVPRTREETRKIREWARAKGIPCGNRGRLPVSVVRAYENEMKESK